MRWLMSIGLTVALCATAAAEQPKNGGACLRWVDVDTLTRSGPDTVLARSRRKGDFVIKFKGRCGYQRDPENYFIVRMQSRWECVDTLGLLELNEGGSCFIESITPVAKDKPNGES